MATLYTAGSDTVVAAATAQLAAALPVEWDWVVGATVANRPIPHLILSPYGVAVVMNAPVDATPDLLLVEANRVAELAQGVVTYLQQPMIAAQIWQDVRMARLLVPLGILLSHRDAPVQEGSTIMVWDDAVVELPTLITTHGKIELHLSEQVAIRKIMVGIMTEQKEVDDDVPSGTAAPSLLRRAWAWWHRLTRATESWEEILTGTGFAALKYSVMEQVLGEALQATLLDLPNETIAHNAFTLFWSDEDGARYAPYKERVVAHLTAYVERQVRQNQWHTEGSVYVEVTVDPTLTPGNCRADSRVQEGTPPTGTDVPVVGGSHPYLEITANHSIFVLNRTLTTIGRDANCHLVLQSLDPDNVTSRRHAQIRLETGQFVLYDGNSTESSFAGTYLNGMRLKAGQGVILQTGDRIILGPPQRVDPQKPMEGSLLLIYREQG